ncbi:MAG: 4-(cytidine 5'-diphospho)-2-C-methyl-D-erythritol kinase [Alphaproteobacteria bacterium]|nr:4-(cytidine 5'-diphospho)-2-C-methyl-D-erythritol kinase [Alphaproteobacteria bacterium]
MPPSGDGAWRIGTAWAKLNLYLHVTAIRPDGYHELDSLFAFAGIGDRLAVRPADRLTLIVDGPFAPAVPADGDNLVLRAARALDGHRGAEIRLTKNLPVASGIGGGSADAAAALRALNGLWQLGLTDAVLERIAAGLGADVPACVASRPVQVSGIGEVLVPAAPLPACWVVLANPGVAVSTPAVFRRFDADARSFRLAAPLGGCATAAELAAALAQRANDLEPSAASLAPEIPAVVEALAGLPGCLLARMSGSGATCFGLFGHEAAAAAGAAALAARHPYWWAASGPLLGGEAGDAVL